jgi:hypothetical protein
VSIRVPSNDRVSAIHLFSAPNAAIVSGRNTTLNLNSPTDRATGTNLPFENGVLVPARATPRGAGFGVANAYQNPRSVQAQARFSF